MSSALFLTLALSLGAGNDPYVRSRVDTGVAHDPNAHCLWWNRQDNPLIFHQNDQGNPETTGDSEFDAARRSIEVWQMASETCGHLQIQEGIRLADRKIGFVTGAADNRNIILYRQTLCQGLVRTTNPCWSALDCQNKYDCWDGQRGTIALTTTTYDVKTGEIMDADIEMNAASFVFTTVDAPPCVDRNYHQGCVATDVENTITHELGHALGLDHTGALGSTMNPSAPPGELSKRSLDPGTHQFVCDVYPRGAPPRDCVIEPLEEQLGKSASCNAVGGSSFLLALTAGALAVAGRRRSPRG